MLENAHLYSLAAGARGFDADAIVTDAVIRDAIKKKFTYIGRYVRRTTSHDYDLTAIEAERIVNAGLGLFAIQHVAPDRWKPTGDLGFQYGRTCADELDHIGLPPGTIAVLDLEGVADAATAEQVIAYCNQWHSVVASRGFVPCLYIGWESGLTGRDAYWRLRFTRYWGAYNVNSDQAPAVRGFQLQQQKQVKVGGIMVDPLVANPDKLGSSFIVLRREDGLSGVRREAGVARKARKRAR
jgi:hypothetical protein